MTLKFTDPVGIIMADKIINVADHGDVVLKVGQGNDVVRIRVDSYILRFASRSFKAMLGPNFADGKNLSYDNPKEIALTDDDPEAIQAICQVLHLKNHSVVKNLESRTILKIAQTSDKYFLREAISFAMAKWLSAKSMKSFEDCGRLLAAAALSDQLEAITHLTATLVLELTDSYITLIEVQPSPKIFQALCKLFQTLDIVANIYIDILDQKRTNLRREFDQAVHDAIKQDESLLNCDCLLNYKRELTKFINTKRLQPRDRAVKSLKKCVKDLLGFRLGCGTESHMPSCGRRNTCEAPNKIWEALRLCLESISSFQGLNLDNEINQNVEQ